MFGRRNLSHEHWFGGLMRLMLKKGPIEHIKQAKACKETRRSLCSFDPSIRYYSLVSLQGHTVQTSRSNSFSYLCVDYDDLLSYEYWLKLMQMNSHELQGLPSKNESLTKIFRATIVSLGKLYRAALTTQLRL